VYTSVDEDRGDGEGDGGVYELSLIQIYITQQVFSKVRGVGFILSV
jgi:hypothetical protein